MSLIQWRKESAFCSKIKWITIGTGHIIVPGMVEVRDGSDKGTVLSTEKILIATGCAKNSSRY